MFNHQGIPLYWDDDHLSYEGSVYQAEHLLAPYLNVIAQEFKRDYETIRSNMKTKNI